jgi:hypothetical protein
MDLCKLQNVKQSSSLMYMQICDNVIAERMKVQTRRCVSYTVFYFPPITQAILKSVGQAVSTERKISVFPFHKSNLCRQSIVVHLAEQNNQSVAMNHNT